MSHLREGMFDRDCVVQNHCHRVCKNVLILSDEIHSLNKIVRVTKSVICKCQLATRMYFYDLVNFWTRSFGLQHVCSNQKIKLSCDISVYDFFDFSNGNLTRCENVSKTGTLIEWHCSHKLH